MPDPFAFARELWNWLLTPSRRRVYPRRLGVEPLEDRVVPAVQPLSDMFLVAPDAPQLVVVLDPDTGREAGVTLGQAVAFGDDLRRVPLLDPETQTPVGDFYPLDPSAWAGVFVGGPSRQTATHTEGTEGTPPPEATREGVAGVVVVSPAADDMPPGADGPWEVPTPGEIVDAIRAHQESMLNRGGLIKQIYKPSEHPESKAPSTCRTSPAASPKAWSTFKGRRLCLVRPGRGLGLGRQLSSAAAARRPGTRRRTRAGPTIRATPTCPRGPLPR